MELFNLNIINFLLKINIKIGKKLVFYQAKYTAIDEVNQKIQPKTGFNLDRLKERFKNIYITDASIRAERMKICNSCEHLWKPTKQCKVCKCFMEIKHRLATSSCPLNPPKWGKEYDFIKGEAVNGN